MGDVVYPGDGRTDEELMRRADAALYRAKARSGNALIKALPRDAWVEADPQHPPIFERPDQWSNDDLESQRESSGPSNANQMSSPADLITFERRGLGSPMRAPRNNGTTAMRVAIVEDDPSQAELLGHWLRLGGHRSHHFDQGAAVIHALSQRRFDALVLDGNLRDIGGVEVLRRIRGSGESSLAILFSSTRGREEDVVSALRHGADDYMIKPIHYLEFIARLEAIARREGTARSSRKC